MANTTIRFRRSNTTPTPTTILMSGEPAFSYASNNLFIGAQSGIGTTAVLIGGVAYQYVNTGALTPGTLNVSSSSVPVLNATGGD